MDYLQQHKDTLIPEFRQVWEAAGFKTSGTWEEVFGKGAATDEIFMAWNYARYIGRVAEAGKAEYPMPMFVNAALLRNLASTGSRNPEPSSPSAAPWPTCDGRLESRGAANRHALARHLQRQGLRGVLRQVHPVREPAVHTREHGRAGRRGQSALRLRTPRCHRLLGHGASRTRGYRIPTTI